MTEENIVKKVCKTYKLTYEELGNEIGYSKSALNNASRLENHQISLQLQKVIELFTQIKSLENQNKDILILKEALKNLIKD